MSLLEQFKDPALMVEMTFGEKLLASTYTAILGMGITFVVLVLIWGAIVLMTKFTTAIERKPAGSQVVKDSPKKAAPAPASAPVEVVADDSELVAVIAAAVAASLGTTPERIRVTNIVRTYDTTPTWGQAGRREMIDNAL